eukprot:9407852-Pyramimonas_sp.AAC.2
MILAGAKSSATGCFGLATRDILSPLARLVPAMGIFSLPFRSFTAGGMAGNDNNIDLQLAGGTAGGAHPGAARASAPEAGGGQRAQGGGPSDLRQRPRSGGVHAHGGAREGGAAGGQSAPPGANPGGRPRPRHGKQASTVSSVPPSVTQMSPHLGLRAQRCYTNVTAPGIKGTS